MALLTNKLGISLAHEEFDARYDVFEVTKEGKGRLSWSSRVFEAFGAPYILSILGQGGDDPFYILAPKGLALVRGLRDHFEKSYGGVIEDEDLEPADVATNLLPKQVPSRDVPEHVLVQLLLNALFAGNSENGPSLQNVTGHLYCFKTGRDWVKKTKSGRNLHIIGLELKVMPESLLKVNVRTFTRANAAGLIFDDRKKSEFPRYVVDFDGPTMRRVSPGESPEADNVFIQKQYEGKKSKIPFLKYGNRKAFVNSKCGVIQEVVERFNETYAGMANISFQAIDDSRRAPVPKKLMKVDYPAWFARDEYVVVDVAKDAASRKACEFVADWLAFDEHLGARPRIMDSAVAGANNLLILHEKAYYKDLGIDDPYASSVLEGAACQHLIVETVQSEFGKPEEDSGMRFVILKCLVEAAVKRDICDAAMRLYDWSALECDGPLIFALYGPEAKEEKKERERGKSPRRYSFLEVNPRGALAFYQGCSDNAVSGSKWDELADAFTSEWSYKTEGFVVNAAGDIDVIEVTDGFPVPDLAAIKCAVESIDWSLPKSDVLEAVSTLTEDPAVDVALRALCEEVSKMPDPLVKASKLNSLVVDAARMIDRSYPARRIRELVDARLEERFARRLLTGVLRDKEALATTFEPIVKMHCVRDDDSLLYWVSKFDGLSRTGRENGCVIRSVRSVNGENPFFTDLLVTLVAPIARLGNASVLPLPFKYLREWIQTQQQSERG